MKTAISALMNVQPHERLIMKYISLHQEVDEAFIYKYHEFIDWSLLLRNHKVSMKCIEEHIDHIHMADLEKQDLSEEFILAHKGWKGFNLQAALRSRFISEKFIICHIKDFSRDTLIYIIEHQIRSIQFKTFIIDKYLKDVKFKTLVFLTYGTNPYAESMLPLFIDQYDLPYITRHEQLPDRFIMEFHSHLYIPDVIQFQKLSTEVLEFLIVHYADVFKILLDEESDINK